MSSETEALILQGDAFARALERFVAAEDDARLDLLAVYRSPRLRRLVGELYERLRGIGSSLELRPFRSPDLPAALADLERAATELGGEQGRRGGGRSGGGRRRPGAAARPAIPAAGEERRATPSWPRRSTSCSRRRWTSTQRPTAC